LYDEFRKKLETFLQDPMLTPTDVKVIPALNVLRTEMEMEVTIVEEEYLEIESGVREMATYTRPSWTVDYALKILVQNAIKEFGYAPRDMRWGVFDPQMVKDNHDAAFSALSFQDLEGFVQAFSRRQFLEKDTYRILQVYPHPPNVDLSDDKWTVDFKTDHIAKVVSGMMREIEDQHLRVTYRIYRNNSITSAFAGSLFESIIHNMLTLGWRSVPPPPICMSTKAKSNVNFPIFTTDPPSTSFSTPPSLSSLFKSRHSTEFDFDRTASINDHVTLEENVLYLHCKHELVFSCQNCEKMATCT
jgi:hypothetical protein